MQRGRTTYRPERPKGAKDEFKWLASIADQVQGRLYRPERPKGAKDEVKWLA